MAVTRTVPDEVPRPYVGSVCRVCRVKWHDVAAGLVVVSPTDKAHFGEDYGMTKCGKDATGALWWWPL